MKWASFYASIKADMYKTVFKDGDLILLEPVYYEAMHYFAKKWKNVDLSLVDFEGKIEDLKEQMKTSRDPFWEIGCMNLCEEIIEILEKEEK